MCNRGDATTPSRVHQLHDSPSRYLSLMRRAVPLYDRLQDEVVRAAAEVQASRILDLGAGTGETARRCLAVHPEAGAVLLDASAGMLELARETLPDVELCVGRLEDPLPAGHFDLVVSALAVHHLPGRGKADLFRRVAGRLAPAGRFVVADVVQTDDRVATPAPLDPAIDFPERVEIQLEWLHAAGFVAAVRWAEADLAVLAGDL
jgi:tRNA (cmo5U34)-methyltransferase